MPGDGVDPDGTWARAVALGGEGRYAAAETLLRRLRAGPGVPQRLRAHAGVTRASHLRQVGAHARAAVVDAAGARLARPLVGDRAPEPGSDREGTGPAAALGDALAGLAADAIGRWDVAGAERLLRRAAPWCGVPGGAGPDAVPATAVPPASRTAVRWLWVRAETHLLAGDAGPAVHASAAAHDLAAALGSPRHLLKSRLVHAVARAVAGEPAVEELDAVADEAGAAGLLPLRWAALLAASDLADVPGAGNAGSGDVDVPPNERHAGASPPDTLSRQAVAQSRRHAAMLAMNAIYLRSDPVMRDGMREAAWHSAAGAVPY